MGYTHQEQVPRKQGLKHKLIGMEGEAAKASRASSTKTRIETESGTKMSESFGTSRASSTKTRIETKPIGEETNDFLRHQEQVPRKQGLKLAEACSLSLPALAIKSKFHENKD